MIDACALYFPVEKLPLEDLLPKGRSDKSFFRAPTWYEFDAGDGVVRLNLSMKDLEQHLRGFKAYVAQLPNDGPSRAEAQRLISLTKLSVGVVLPHPIAAESRTFDALMKLLERRHGFMFVADSILLPDGTFLVGPMADPGGEVESVEPPIRPVNPAEYRHEGKVEGVAPGRIASRENVYRLLASRGFRCCRTLPLYRNDNERDVLRPTTEIVARLFALDALFLWVAAPEDVAATDQLQAFIDRNNLRAHLTAEELPILDLSRSDANEQHAGTIGWRLENMWALSWILGFDPCPPFYTGQLSTEVRDQILFEFLPPLQTTVPDFVAAATIRLPAEVGEAEDIFYCTHNAVRSAQLGEDTVPREFHPVRDGGAIHERRHALTWALSPGIEWDETDIST